MAMQIPIRNAARSLTMGDDNDDGAVSSSSPTDWQYVSEGGASIVFAYRGPLNAGLDGTVLRLRKCPVGTPSSTSPDFNAPDPSVAFQQSVVAQLIESAFLPRLDPVRISRPWLQELALLAEPSRPSQRRAVDRIDISRRTAVLATDLVGNDGLAVEIKVRYTSLSAFHLFLDLILSIAIL